MLNQLSRILTSCSGKITSLSITPSSDAADAEKSATVTFEKETAAKTALLLDNTQLGKSQVHVSTASTLDDVASKIGAAVTSSTAEDHLDQEDKPRSRIVAEYLAHGYTLSDNVIQRAIALDSKHGFSNRFTSALAGFDDKYKATDKAKAVDTKYGVTEKTMGASAGLNSYFEKPLNTPTGQKVRSFYVEGDKQVRDVHNEARRLADLKSGKSTNEPGTGDNTTGNEPTPVSNTDKTVCKCGGTDSECPCPPGHCTCARCSKSSIAATTEAKEAAQASGQTLPAGSV